MVSISIPESQLSCIAFGPVVLVNQESQKSAVPILCEKTAFQVLTVGRAADTVNLAHLARLIMAAGQICRQTLLFYHGIFGRTVRNC